uniref:Uncharacterized protein n=1 Tax=Strigamia maritima TaxID=126957 RepID=T1JJP4_STRMM
MGQSNTATMKREPGLSEVSSNPPAPNSHSSAGETALDKLVTGREFPPPIRIAKMIDVVSRVVFPIAYGIFLIFFFVRFRNSKNYVRT